LIGKEPLHVPGEAVSVSPTRGVPASVGGDVFAGPVPTGWTAAVWADVADDDPALLLAVTTTASVFPTSAATGT
jgi:hypothetical protein